MKRFWLILLWSFWSFSQQPTANLETILAQANSDTARVTVLCKLSIAESDSTKSLRFAKQAIRLSEKMGSASLMATSLYAAGIQYESRSDYMRAIKLHKRALLLASDKRLQSKILTAIGSCYMYLSKYTQASSHYHRALKIDESLGDKKGIAKVAMNIGSVYYSIKDYPKSIAYFNLAIAQKIDDPTHRAMLFRNLGAVYNTMARYDKALAYFQKSLTTFEHANNAEGAAKVLSDIALVYYDKKLYAKAISYSKAALKKNPQADDKINRAFSYGIIGDTYTEMAKSGDKTLLDSAVIYLKKSISLHEELNNIRGLYDDLTSLSTAQKLAGDYKAAMAALEKSIIYKDSIFNSDNRETIKNIEDKRQIEIRDRELKINKITLEAEERQNWFLVFAIVLLIVIAGMFFYQSYNRKKNNVKLNKMNEDLDRANRTKTRLLSILNHDLRSPLNSFIHFVQFQKESPEMLDDVSKARIENATINSAKDLLESMEDMLLWTKDQMENFDPQFYTIPMDDVFEDLKKHFSTLKVSLAFESRQHLSVHTDENYLKTILRNIISNAAKALDGTADAKIEVAALTKNGKVSITVSDNGPGGTSEQFRALYDEREIIGVRNGLGLHLVRDLARAIGCKIWVDTNAGEGTLFTLTFP